MKYFASLSPYNFSIKANYTLMLEMEKTVLFTYYLKLEFVSILQGVRHSLLVFEIVHFLMINKAQETRKLGWFNWLPILNCSK